MLVADMMAATTLSKFLIASEASLYFSTATSLITASL